MVKRLILIFFLVIFISSVSFAGGGKAASLNATGYDWLGYSKEDKASFANLAYVVHNVDKKKNPVEAIIKKLDAYYYGALDRAKKDPMNVDEDKFLNARCIDVIAGRI